MIDPPRHNHDVYCYLKRCLEPQFSVVAEPQAGYFAQWQFCYRVLDGPRMLAELQGDFRDLPAGSLITRSVEIVNELLTDANSRRDCGKHSTQSNEKRTAVSALPIASRLPPQRVSRTWFSSGRAAFTWLLNEVVRPRRVFLPTYICWSLVDVMRSRFPDVPLEFYSVDQNLQSAGLNNVDPDDAVVDIHYFGHRSSLSRSEVRGTVLEDCSHCLPDDFQNPNPASTSATQTSSAPTIRFGSLRKVYRVADGGFIDGEFCPEYEPDLRLDAWLRMNASDWRDLREAENMFDRQFCISDISSQSLAVILNSSPAAKRRQRQRNNQFLNQSFPCGRPLVDFDETECPLLHNRCLDSVEERDSLRAFLLAKQIFTSIHWPVHDDVMRQQDVTNIEGAVWLQNHSFAIPIAEDFGERHMHLICDAVNQWMAAGSTRFPSS